MGLGGVRPGVREARQVGVVGAAPGQAPRDGGAVHGRGGSRGRHGLGRVVVEVGVDHRAAQTFEDKAARNRRRSWRHRPY